MNLTVTDKPQENFSFNPKVQSAPVSNAPLKVAPVQQPQLASRVVQASPQPQISVQPINPQPQINVDNSPRFVPLGEAVKLKYPGAYDDMDSGQLGKLVAIQYPGIYDDLIEPASEFVSEPEHQGLGGIKGFALGATKGALNTAKNLAGLVAKTPENLGVINPFGIISKTAGKINEKLSEADLKPAGKAEKFGFGTEQIAEFFVPAGGVAKAGKAIEAGVQGLNIGSKATKALSLGGKIGLGAGEAAGITAIQGGSKSDIKTAAVLGGSFAVIAKGLESVIKSVPETAWSSILKRTPTEAAKNPNLTKQAAETGLSGFTRQSIADKAQSAIQSIEVTLDDLLSKSTGKINTAKVVGYLGDLRNSYAAIPGEKSSVKAIDDIAAELYERFKVGQSMTAVEANQLKRNIYQVIAKSYGKGMLEVPAKTEAQKLVAAGLKREIEKIIPEAKSLNEKQAVYIQIKKALDKTIARTEGKGIAGTGVGLYDLLLGGIGTGAGALAGSPMAGLALVIGKKTAESPIVLSSTAKLLEYFNSLSPTKKLLFYQGIKGLVNESSLGIKNAVKK